MHNWTLSLWIKIKQKERGIVAVHSMKHHSIMALNYHYIYLHIAPLLTQPRCQTMYRKANGKIVTVTESVHAYVSLALYSQRTLRKQTAVSIMYRISQEFNLQISSFISYISAKIGSSITHHSSSYNKIFFCNNHIEVSITTKPILVHS